jgi:putative phosphoribosyl transferase
MLFADRADAGRRLAARLEHLRGEPVVVLGLRARLLRLSADD